MINLNSKQKKSKESSVSSDKEKILGAWKNIEISESQFSEAVNDFKNEIIAGQNSLSKKQKLQGEWLTTLHGRIDTLERQHYEYIDSVEKRLSRLCDEKIANLEAKIESLVAELNWQKRNDIGQSGIIDLKKDINNYRPSLREAPVWQNGHEIDQEWKNRKIARVFSMIPLQNTSNPIAALINFCKHQLHFDVDFSSSEALDGIHTVTVKFGSCEVFSECDRKKKTAKERASKHVIMLLHTDAFNKCIQKYISKGEGDIFEFFDDIGREKENAEQQLKIAKGIRMPDESKNTEQELKVAEEILVQKESKSDSIWSRPQSDGGGLWPSPSPLAQSHAPLFPSIGGAFNSLFGRKLVANRASSAAAEDRLANEVHDETGILKMLYGSTGS